MAVMAACMAVTTEEVMKVHTATRWENMVVVVMATVTSVVDTVNSRLVTGLLKAETLTGALPLMLAVVPLATVEVDTEALVRTNRTVKVVRLSTHFVRALRDTTRYLVATKYYNNGGHYPTYRVGTWLPCEPDLSAQILLEDSFLFYWNQRN